jgi:copper homeostasis protein cutC
VDVTYRYTDKGDYEEVNPKELALAIDIVKKLNKEM